MQLDLIIEQIEEFLQENCFEIVYKEVSSNYVNFIVKDNVEKSVLHFLILVEKSDQTFKMRCEIGNRNKHYNSLKDLFKNIKMKNVSYSHKKELKKIILMNNKIMELQFLENHVNNYDKLPEYFNTEWIKNNLL